MSILESHPGLQARRGRRRQGRPAPGRDRGGRARRRPDPRLRRGAAPGVERRRLRPDRRDQAREPVQGADPRRLRPRGPRRRLRRRRRRLPERADRRPELPGRPGAPRRRARRLRPAGAAQGLHRRPLAGRGIARDGRGLHPDHHGDARRRRGRRDRERRAGVRPRRPDRDAHRGRGRARQGAALAADRHQQPQPAHVRGDAGDDAGDDLLRARGRGSSSPRAGILSRRTTSAGCSRRVFHAFLVGEAFMCCSTGRGPGQRCRGEGEAKGFAAGWPALPAGLGAAVVARWTPGAVGWRCRPRSSPSRERCADRRPMIRCARSRLVAPER